jgi:hypothetical protein
MIVILKTIPNPSNTKPPVTQCTGSVRERFIAVSFSGRGANNDFKGQPRSEAADILDAIHRL